MRATIWGVALVNCALQELESSRVHPDAGREQKTTAVNYRRLAVMGGDHTRLLDYGGPVRPLDRREEVTLAHVWY